MLPSTKHLIKYRNVRADSLEPRQIVTPTPFQVATDFRQQVMLKHPFLSHFHSLAEHLHAGLLEGNPNVISYVPQPFKLMIGNRRYSPDCYVVSKDIGRLVVELRPKGKMKDELEEQLVEYFKQQGMTFKVISNESIYEKRIEAENWLLITSTLHQARHLDTQAAEQKVLDFLWERDGCIVADLIDVGDRDRSLHQEIALFRLLHRGLLRATLADQVLDFNTEISRCT